MRKFDPRLLPYLAATAQAIQFTHAGYVLLGWAGIPIGLGIGATVSLSAAYAATRISDVAKTRRPLSVAGLVTLMLISPACIAPASYLSFDGIGVEWVRILAAVVWAVAPDIAVVLSGAVAGKSLMHVEQPAAPVERKPAKPKNVFSKMCDCGKMFSNARAYAGHCRVCVAHRLAHPAKINQLAEKGQTQ